MANPEDYIVRFTDPARSDGELTGSSFVIRPFTVDGPQHPTVDDVFVDPETGSGTTKRSPVVLFGKGIPEYGEQHANNFLQLTENFAGASAPLINASGSPLPGVSWFRDERYWVDSAGGVIYVWDDVNESWDDVSSFASTNSVTFDVLANRPAAGVSTSGDYFYATDTEELFVFYTWVNYTPPISKWLSRIARVETVAPTTELPRRTLAVYDPTKDINFDPAGLTPVTRGFTKLLSYAGNDAGDPILGDVFVDGNITADDPTVAGHVATKDYVDTEIATAIGGSNEFYQLLDVNSALDATTGSTVTNNEFVFFDTSLSDASFDGRWNSKLLTHDDITDFDAEVAAIASSSTAATSIGALSDVDLTGIATDDILVWNGSEFVAEPDKYVFGDGEGGNPTPAYTANDGTNEVVLTRSDGQVITIENVATNNNLTAHINSATAHDSVDIEYTGPALTVGTPSDVETALILLDGAITASSGGYVGIQGSGIGSTGSASVGAESPSSTIVFRTASPSVLTIQVNDNAPDDNVTFTFNPSGIDHDALLNFVANEHVDHSAVNLTAGNGLTGGGDITTSRAFNVGAGTGIAVGANDVALDTGNTRNTDHAAINLTAGSGLTGGGDITASRSFTVGAGAGITVGANDVALDTASTRNTDHAAVNITAGTALSGGGNITTSRTLNWTGVTLAAVGNTIFGAPLNNTTYAPGDTISGGSLGYGHAGGDLFESSPTVILVPGVGTWRCTGYAIGAGLVVSPGPNAMTTWVRIA